MHTPLSYRSPWRFKPSPTLFCDSLILRQAADVQEIFGIERLEPWGMGAAKSSVASQVSLPPPLNWASPAASSPLCPSLKMYVAADAQEIIRSELLEPRGNSAAKGEEEDHGTTPACSTRAAMKKVCLLCQIICKFDLWPNCVCLDR